MLGIPFMLKSMFSVCLVVMVGFLAACTTTEISTISTQSFSSSDSRAETTVVAKLTEGDSLQVSVEVDGVMEVSGHMVGVNHKGCVTLPLVGDVHVGSMTVEQARFAILKTYGTYYVNPPVIMLSMIDAPEVGEWGYITVMGRVANPGRFPLPDADGISLTHAIQLAGGFTPSAKQSGIKVSRVDPQGQKLQVMVNYNDIGAGGNANADVSLQAGDIIYVPERIF